MARETRVVKLGRKMMMGKIFGPLSTIPHHWAIKVGDIWYEIEGLDIYLKEVLNGKSWNAKRITVNRSVGNYAKSGAGYYGGEVVGTTTKTDKEISEWINKWVKDHANYNLLLKNCHKFAIDLMDWLTDGMYRCEHPAHASGLSGFFNFSGFSANDEGNAIASCSVAQGRARLGVLEGKLQIVQGTAQAVCGPGLGLFLDATVAEAKVSVGNIFGIRGGLNGNTGLGARNGNIEAHLLGFGGKIGADGIEINTPIGGVHGCSIM